MRCKQMHINIRYENPKLEAWFLSQMKRAEVIISKALDRVEKLDNSFDKRSLERVAYHASVIDLELIQLMNRQYDDLEGSEVV